MLRVMLVVAAAAIVGGCASQAPVPVATPAAQASPETEPGYQRPADGAALASAQRAVKDKLRDPDSAKFDKVARKTVPNARGEPTDVVCGRINAKNAYGGMIGFKDFVYLVAWNQAIVAEGDELNHMVVRNICVGFS